MTYPYIGKLVDAFGDFSVAVFCSNNLGALLENSIDSNRLHEFEGDFNDREFTNITTEYLANTYGEVKSKEHAEFIKLLAETNGIKLIYEPSDNIKSFEISGGDLILHSLSVAEISVEGLKQIIIPLPPECESVDEWPKVGSSVEWGHTGKGEIKSLSDGFAWIKLDNKDYTTVYVSSLRKPKTPEQELEYNLTDLIMRARDTDVDDVTIARSILSKYEIKKKS